MVLSNALSDSLPKTFVLPAALVALMHRAADYTCHSIAYSTRHFYAKNQNRLVLLHVEVGLEALPATPSTAHLLAGQLFHRRLYQGD